MSAPSDRQTDTELYEQLDLLLPGDYSEEDLACIAGALEDFGAAAVSRKDAESGMWRLQWFGAGLPANGDIVLLIRSRIDARGEPLALPPEPAIERMPVDTARDWLAESYKGFPPFAFPPFYIYGAHCREVPLPPESAGLTGLCIDAATAFGSGEHATTRGCLHFMARFYEDGAPARVLDLGTGSGILAIAAAKLWPDAEITASDIDPESIAVTARHMEMNGVPPERIRLLTGPGFDAPGFEDVSDAGSGFNLIIANILAPPLRALMPEIAARLGAGGQTILAGLLAEQAGDLIARAEDCGLRLNDRITETRQGGAWTTLLLGTRE